MHRSKGKLSGVLHKGFKPDKCKTSLRMAVARIKLLRNRKEVVARQMRREVAQLLEANQDMTARIRVEHVIREEKLMQAYDLIEVYCELIVARLAIIDSQKACPIDLKEAIASVLFASMRCSDLTELADVRKHFTSKYGKEFAAAALEVRPDSGVNRLVIEKLSAGAPDIETKIKTLTSIAEEHNIKWEPKAFEEKLQKPNKDNLYGSATYSGGNVSTMGSSTSSRPTPQPTYSSVPAATVDSATSSHVPVGPYSPVDVSANRNSSAFSQENVRSSSGASVLPSSQHGASSYYSEQIPGPNSFSHGSTEAPPYTQYGTRVPETVSRNEEMNQHRERKPSVSGANWNMEFKDATSAAQAAAESAEMASIAARAAAQLASRGNYSGDQSTGAYEAAAYSHENTPRKQPAEHLGKDEHRSFHDHSSGIDDPRVMPSYSRKSSGRAETNRVESQNISTVHAPVQNQNVSTVHGPAQQFHSYSPESHVYEMPTEPPRAHSPEPPHFDDIYERESNTGRSEVHPFDFPEEKLQETGPGGRNVTDVEIRKPDQESTNNYFGNFSSSQDTFSYGSSTVWDKQNDKTKDSSSVVFDQYDSDVEENLLDTFSSKHTEQPPVGQDHMEFATADWSQQRRSESPNHRTSMLFSRTESQKSDNLGTNRRDVPSPHIYDNLPPTFDSDGSSSDEEIATTMRTESLKSASSGLNREADRISGKVVPDVKESIEDYESSSSKKYVASPGLNLSYKEKRSDGTGDSPVSDYLETQEQRHLNRVQSRHSDLSDEETETDKFESASSPGPGANENQSLPFAIRTSATSDDKEGVLSFGRLTPGLRNKPRQPPPYTKSSRENILPRQRQSFPKASASTEESVDSEENTTTFEQNRSSPKSSLSTRTSSGGNYNSELYDRNQIVGTRGETRSTMARNFFDSDDKEKLYEQSINPSPPTTKSSERVNSNQELYNEKPGTGARQEMRSRMAKSYFDSDDSEEELEQQLTTQPKRSGVQIQSRRTRDVTSDTKRDDHVRTGARYADETESLPKETKAPQLNNSSTEQRRVAPAYPRVAVQRSSPKSEHVESPMAARGKSQETEMSRSSVPGNVGITESSAVSPKESTPKTPPAHVHPKLPTDYDSFAAHFKSLRTNPR